MAKAGRRRATAHVVLITFTTALVACEASPTDASTTSTLPAAMESATTLPPPPPALPTPPATFPAQPPEQLTGEELRDLVAPVALYPDVVLASLLPATTFPEQIHEAAQWVGPAHTVQRLPDDRSWDGSVLGLLQFPDVLRWLDDNPAWTDEMGQAVTYQQGDVLDAIQDYRRAVRDAGNLTSNQYQTVRDVPDQPKRDIYIEPARPDVVYVPSYDPVLATQPQPVPESAGINPWIAFGGGAVVGALGAWALYSIFDDDGDTYNYNYYGGGRRRIRAYDNYYYYGRRRPRQVEWAPRRRPHRARQEGWRKPRPLKHTPASGRPGRGLRAPTTPPGQRAPRPAEVRRERRQERREQRQERQTERREQRQQRQQQRRDQREQHQEQRQQQRQEQREHRQERQEQRHEQRQERRQDRQEQRQQRHGQQQERRQERREQREERHEQRQEMRQERRDQRQERRQQNQAERQDDRSGKKKKRQQQGQ